MSRALDYLYTFRANRRNKKLWFDMVLQIHDAVILEVPIHSIKWVMEEVLPKCMSEMVDVWPCNLDGVVPSDVKEPYHLGIDKEAQLRWGEPLTKADAQKYGIPLEYAHA